MGEPKLMHFKNQDVVKNFKKKKIVNYYLLTAKFYFVYDRGSLSLDCEIYFQLVL